MLLILVMALAFCLIVLALGALGVGIGFLLKICIPSLQIGHAVVAGSIISVASVHFFRRLMHAISSQTEEGDEIPDDHPVPVLPKDFRHHLPRRPRPRRKRK